MLEYVAKFTELARFADDYAATDMVKVRKFEDVTPQTRGSVDNPSTRRIHVAIACLNAIK